VSYPRQRIDVTAGRTEGQQSVAAQPGAGHDPLSRREFLWRAGIGASALSIGGVLGPATAVAHGQVAAAAKKGGTLVFPVDDMTGNLEPGIFATYADWMGVEMVARGLTHCDFRSGTIQPAVAKSWTISSDRTVYTFHLRSGLTFHDGTPVTAQDFARSWTRLVNPKDPTQAPGTFTAFALLGVPVVASWKALDAHTFQVKLDGPDESFLARCGTLAGAVVSSKALDRYGKNIGRNLVGCGPFKFAGFTQGQKCVFTAFDGYYAGRPSVNEVIYQIITDPTAMESALASGAAQASDFESLTSLSALKGPLDVATGTPRQQIFCWMNASAPSLKDIRVRQAINYCIDRKRVISEGLNGYGVEPAYIVADGIPGYSASLKPYSTQDLAKARSLVKAAGAQGRTVKFIAPNNRWWPTVGQIVEENVLSIGLKPEFTYLDEAAFTTAETTINQHEVALDSFTAPIVDPDNAARSIFLSTGTFSTVITGQFTLKTVSAKLDALLVQARQEPNPASRAQHYVEFQRIAAEELMVIAMLAYNPAPVAYAKNVVGLDIDALCCYHGFLETAAFA